MQFQKIYYEPGTEEYPLGKSLLGKYRGIPKIPIESHNHIPELRARPNADFGRLKQYLILGTRKTHRYVPNRKVSDFLVPFTSSGCTAMCLYCYLVCNYNTCSYLRVFVNREQMMEKLLRKAQATERECVFEIGSNSDLILENEVTGNLPWVVERFAECGRGFLTFPTKFSGVEPLLGLRHGGRTIVRVSMNPERIIRTVELGTASLADRIQAVNRLAQAGYPVGILIAPVILTERFCEEYGDLIEQLREALRSEARRSLFFEVIFMTYSFIHRAINEEAFPRAPQLYDPSRMTGRGRGKYAYRPEEKEPAERFLREKLRHAFPEAKIVYVV